MDSIHDRVINRSIRSAEREIAPTVPATTSEDRERIFPSLFRESSRFEKPWSAGEAVRKAKSQRDSALVLYDKLIV